MILAVVLAWQMVVALMSDRAPGQIALTLAPRSPVALVRAADAELQAKRYDNAGELARRALQIAPFDARALSIIGLAQAARGEVAAADETLTLAGNWSLREDPVHSWLVDRRLRQGDYASAFAHAETLVRRRSPAEPQLFEMFTIAAAQPSGLSVLMDRLSASPPWRSRYLTFLFARPGQDSEALYSTLAVNLQRSSAPLSDGELGALYWRWLAAGRYTAIFDLRNRLGRPTATDAIWNGSFGSIDGIPPLAWNLSVASGFSVQISDTGDAGGGALQIDYDGLAVGVIAEQLIFLPAGDATLRVRRRSFGDLGDSRLEWRLVCPDGRPIPIRWHDQGANNVVPWQDLSGSFTVPTAGCIAQRLKLTATPGDRRRSVTVWFDDLAID